MNQSSKLSNITVFLIPSDNFEQLFSWFKNEGYFIYQINDFHAYPNGPRKFYKTGLCIWTSGRGINWELIDILLIKKKILSFL